LRGARVKEGEMSKEILDYEFFEMIPENEAEAQAAADAAADLEWSKESRRVTRKAARLGAAPLEF
jgi:hypothetical protein